MKLYFDEGTGIIHYAINDRDLFNFNPPAGLTEFSIDEIAPDNKAICIDILKNYRKHDSNGLSKFYMQSDGGIWNLYERDGWTEEVG